MKESVSISENTLNNFGLNITKLTNSSSLQLIGKNGESFTIESKFIEWLTGFTDPLTRVRVTFIFP
jgi:hypothetical protein